MQCRRRSNGSAKANRANGTWHDARSLEIAPNLWAAVGLVRSDAGTALVGGHTDVPDRIAEYASIGIEEFIFSGARLDTVRRSRPPMSTANAGLIREDPGIPTPS